MGKKSAFFKASVDIDGLARLQRTLKEAGDDLEDLKEANRKAAESILPIAAGMAPYDSGKLKRSLRTGATRRTGVLRFGKKAVPYAGPRHWGWPAKGWKPNPFAANAAIQNQHVWERAYMDALNDAVKKVKGKK